MQLIKKKKEWKGADIEAWWAKLHPCEASISYEQPLESQFHNFLQASY